LKGDKKQKQLEYLHCVHYYPFQWHRHRSNY